MYSVRDRPALMGRSMTRASPAGRGVGVPAPAARIERTSAAFHRPNAVARSSAATNSCVAVGGGKGVQLGQLGPEAGVPSSRRADDERLRGRPEGAELFLRNSFRPDRPTRRRPGPAVVLVADRSLTRGYGAMFGDDLTGRWCSR